MKFSAVMDAQTTLLGTGMDIRPHSLSRRDSAKTTPLFIVRAIRRRLRASLGHTLLSLRSSPSLLRMRWRRDDSENLYIVLSHVVGYRKFHHENYTQAESE